MITVAEAVETLIRRSPFFEEGIVDGVINYTGLARHLQADIEKHLGKEVQTGAIVMAIQRLKPQLSKLGLEEALQDYIQGMGEIIVRSDLIDFTFANSPTLVQKQQLLLRFIEGQKEIFHTLSKGVYETNLVTSRSILPQVEKIFEDEVVISLKDNLASITMRLPVGNINIPGLYYYILKKIAWENINIVEIVSTTNEFTLILNKEDVNRAFQILHDMTQKA